MLGSASLWLQSADRSAGQYVCVEQATNTGCLRFVSVCQHLSLDFFRRKGRPATSCLWCPTTITSILRRWRIELSSHTLGGASLYFCDSILNRRFYRFIDAKRKIKPECHLLPCSRTGVAIIVERARLLLARCLPWDTRQQGHLLIMRMLRPDSQIYRRQRPPRMIYTVTGKKRLITMASGSR